MRPGLRDHRFRKTIRRGLVSGAVGDPHLSFASRSLHDCIDSKAHLSSCCVGVRSPTFHRCNAVFDDESGIDKEYVDFYNDVRFSVNGESWLGASMELRWQSCTDRKDSLSLKPKKST